MYHIKQIPEDFFVREVMHLTLTPGKFTYAVLRKKNWTTQDALLALAKACNVCRERFACAGMKDRDAVTEQHISCENISAETLTSLHIKDITLTPLGTGTERISLAQHTSNYFDIVVRNLEHPLQAILSFSNAFDAQRFGGKRPNTALIGKALLQRNFEKAVRLLLCATFPSEPEHHNHVRKGLESSWGRWELSRVPKMLRTERMVIGYLLKHPQDYRGAFKQIPRRISTLYIHAVQSMIFNEVLRIHPDAHTIPLVGFDYDPTQDAVSQTTRNVLATHGLTPEKFLFTELPFLSSRTVYRAGRVALSDLQIGNVEDDELNSGKKKQRVTFTLPKGSYATLVVQELAKPQDL